MDNKGQAEDKMMTIYFSRSTGHVKEAVQGENDFGFFGIDADDYALIHDYIVLPYDDYVMDNTNKMQVVDGEVKFKEEVDVSKYM